MQLNSDTLLHGVVLHGYVNVMYSDLILLSKYKDKQSDRMRQTFCQLLLFSKLHLSQGPIEEVGFLGFNAWNKMLTFVDMYMLLFAILHGIVHWLTVYMLMGHLAYCINKISIYLYHWKLLK